MKKAIIIIVLLSLAVFSFSCTEDTPEETLLTSGGAPVLSYSQKGFSIYETPLTGALKLTNTDYEALTVTVYSDNGKTCTLSAEKNNTAKAHSLGGTPAAIEINADGESKAYALTAKGLTALIGGSCNEIITLNKITIENDLLIERPLSIIASKELSVKKSILYIYNSEGSLKLDGSISAEVFACRAPLSSVEIPDELAEISPGLYINALSVNGIAAQPNIRIAEDTEALKLLASKPAYFDPESETVIIRNVKPEEDVVFTFPCKLTFDNCTPNTHIRIETEDEGTITLSGDFSYNEIEINAPNCGIVWDNPCTLYYASKHFNAATLNEYKLSSYTLSEKSEAKITSAKMLAEGTLLTEDIYWQVKGNTITATISGVAAPSALRNAELIFETENCHKVSIDKASRGDTKGIDLLDPLGAYVSVKDSSGKTKKYRIITKTKANLPVVIIETENGDEITSKKDYVNAKITLESDFSDGLPSHETATVQIRGRGNSTWYWSNKKPYKIRYEKDVSLLGLREGKDWVLLANYNDKSLIRNYVALESAKVLDNMDCYATQYPVDVYLNGEYIGVYSLGEQIEEGDDRIQLFSDATSVDTGFLMEIGGKAEFDGYNTFTTRYMQCVEILEPSGGSLTAKHKEYIVNYVTMAEEAVRKLEGYEDYIDIDSLIDWLIMTEVSFNSDGAMRRSVFFKKDHGEKLKFGPVWDFDIAYGNSNTDFDNYEAWCCLATNYNYVYENWICRLMEDDAFVEKLTLRWNEKKDELLEASLKAVSYGKSITEHSAKANFKRWDILDVLIGMQPQSMAEYNTYEKQIDYLENFIIERINWIDGQLNGKE